MTEFDALREEGCLCDGCQQLVGDLRKICDSLRAENNRLRVRCEGLGKMWEDMQSEDDKLRAKLGIAVGALEHAHCINGPAIAREALAKLKTPASTDPPPERQECADCAAKDKRIEELEAALVAVVDMSQSSDELDCNRYFNAIEKIADQALGRGDGK